MKQQIVVIHGGEAFNTYKEYIENLRSFKFDLRRMKTKGWKSRLGDHLGKKFDIIAPRMPNPDNAKFKEWKIVFEKLIPHLRQRP